MKTLFLLAILFNQCHSFGQSDLCKYFKLKVEKSDFEGESAIYITPEMKLFEGDNYSNFLNEHKNRFEYILYNKIDSITKYSNYYPDTIKIEREFCNYLQTNPKIRKYFDILSNKNSQKIKFNISEMMKIASRFFLCDRVNELDTTVGYHICIGINGQKELKAPVDYSVLEAFCFEAIFNYINKKDTPIFITNFRSYITSATLMHKGSFRNTNEFLEKIKNDCFKSMENDNALKDCLLSFYSLNKSNLGFTIE
jgi:hypothetical protein